MGLNIDKEVAQMRRMTVGELNDKFVEVCNEQPRSRNKQWLIKRLAWKMQAKEFGGLSEAALRRAKEIADICDLSDLRVSAPPDFAASIPATIDTAPQAPLDSRLPMPGTMLARKYKGETLCVQVLPDGFLFEGERFKSLSAVARKITGSAWNGYLFFGLTKKELPV
jgi:Protein of unknown function (DUF2924)